MLTHGARHTSAPLSERPGAAKQIANIEGIAASMGHRINWWRHDHVRCPKGPGSFPTLFAILALAKEHDAPGRIVLDDAARLFRKLTLKAQTKMLKALEPYHLHILDARRRKLLANLKPMQWMALMLSATDRTDARPQMIREAKLSTVRSTERARRVSRAARAKSADQFAQQILDLRDEFCETGAHPSNVELARVANERGLLTSRGNPWSDVTVGRALKRFTKGKPGTL